VRRASYSERIVGCKGSATATWQSARGIPYSAVTFAGARGPSHPLRGPVGGGATLEDAVRYTKTANGRGIDGVLNLLGAHYTEETLVEGTMREYLRILDAIEREKVRAMR